MADQTERSFQKQPTVFLNRKKGIGVKRSRKPLRYHKDVGLGFKTPRETEKAFQKQATVFLNKKGGMKRKDMRHSKNVGLGFKTPREVWYFEFWSMGSRLATVVATTLFVLCVMDYISIFNF